MSPDTRAGAGRASERASLYSDYSAALEPDGLSIGGLKDGRNAYLERHGAIAQTGRNSVLTMAMGSPVNLVKAATRRGRDA
jgi:hypothetical protein